MSDVDKKFNNMIKRIESTPNISGPQLTRSLHRIGMLLEYKIKESIVKKGLVDMGGLLNSIRYSVEGNTVTVGSYGVIYAKIHEFGGTIYPVRARKLTIPASPWAKYHSARDFKLIRIKNMLVDPKKLGKTGTIPRDAIGFWLASKATIREKRYMRDGVQSATPKIIEILRGLE